MTERQAADSSPSVGIVGETPLVSGALAASSRVSGRDRYLDLLRAIALVRVVAYHSFAGAVWLSMAFPSMGVMFALAGSLMARSLERPALGVLRSRTRRLLLPLWAYSGTVLVLLLWLPWVLSSEWTLFIGVWPLLAVLFLTIGWVEDVAAHRAPRLWPTGSPKRPSAPPSAADRNRSGQDLHSRTADAHETTAGSGLRTSHPRPEEPKISSGELTAVPLARQPGQFTAYKYTVPAGPDRTRPEPRTHDGNGWIYVLKGRLLLGVGDQDVVLTPGQSAEIDAGTPHWIGSAGTEPVEYLDIFAEHGIPASQPESEDSLSTPTHGPVRRAGGHILN